MRKCLISVTTTQQYGLMSLSSGRNLAIITQTTIAGWIRLERGLYHMLSGGLKYKQIVPSVSADSDDCDVLLHLRLIELVRK